MHAEVLAPAKVNLALHVVGRRDDGLHLLETLVVFSGPGDRLAIGPAKHDEFEIHGPFAAALAGQPENLVTAARDLLRARFPAHECPPMRIALEKNLPVAAGIGGGSSDAAAALKALAKLWRLPVAAAELAELALALGADLPMCLHARPLLAGGIGERVREVGTLPALPLLLVNPGVAVATAEVFRLLAARDNAGLPPLPDTVDLRAWIGWLGQTRNDLEAAACELVPEVSVALEALAGSGALVARMSGSGATCYGLFAEEGAMRAAAAAIRAARPEWFVMEASTPRQGEEGPR